MGLEALEARCLLSVGFNEFPVPDAASILNITNGPDGHLWFTVAGNNQVGSMDTNGNVVSEFGSPSGITGFPANSNPEGITTGPDNNIWFTQESAHQVTQMTTQGVILNNVATTGGAVSITTGPDHNIWFTENNDKIGQVELAPDGLHLHEFSLPAGSVPVDITAGPDGALWFTESNSNQIGRIDTSGNISQFNVPTPSSQPNGITAGPDNKLWFTECLGNKIGQFDIGTGQVINEFPLAAHSVPRRITTGPDGQLWFTEQAAQALGEITTDGHLTEFTGLPGFPFGIVSGPDANVWFAEDLAVGRAALPGSDLSVTMHDQSSDDPPHPVVVGTNFALTIPVTNSGPDPATGVTLTTTLPAGFDLVPSLSPGSSVVNGKVITNVGDMAAGNFGGSTTEFITLIIHPNQAGSFTSSTVVSCSSQEKNPANDTASVTTHVLAGIADVGLSMQVTPPQFAVEGDHLTYTLTVTNNGTDTAADVKLTDVLPAGLDFVIASQPFVGGVADLGALAVGGSKTVTIEAVATGTGQVTNQASVTAGSAETNLLNNSASVTTDVLEQSDLVLAMQTSPDPIAVGQTLTYSISVKNNGPGAAQSVLLTDQLPASLQFVSADPALTPDGSFGASFDTSSHSVTVKLGTMDSGSNFNVKIFVRPTQQVTVTNTADVTSSPNTSHDRTSTTTDIQQGNSELSATMAVSDGTPFVGDTITYTIPVTNNGPDIAHGVELADPLPDGLQFVSADPALTPDGSFGASFSAGTVRAKLGDMGAHQTLTVKVFVKVVQPVSVFNAAVITAAAPVNDTTFVGASAQITSSFAPVSLQLIGSLPPNSNPVQRLSDNDFTWDLTNTGSHTATGLVATVTIPSEVAVDATLIKDFAGHVTRDGRTFTFYLDDLPAGASTEFDIVASSSNVGPVALTAFVDSQNPILGGGPLVNTVQELVSSGLTNHLIHPTTGGGPVLQNVRIDEIFYGSQWNTDPTLKSLQGQLAGFFQTITSGPYMDFMAQYNIDSPKQTIGRGTLNGGRVILNTPGSQVTDAQIVQTVMDESSNGELPNSANTLYFVFTPPGSEILGLKGQNSISDFRAYHAVLGTGQGVFYYAPVPYPTGTNGHLNELSDFQNMTLVASHELAEAVTDPRVGLGRGWFDPNAPAGVNEIGDLCANQTLSAEHATGVPPEGVVGDYGMLDGYLVQYLWANNYTYPGTTQTVQNDCALPAETININGTPGRGFAFNEIIPPTSDGGSAPHAPHAASVSMETPTPSFSFSGPIATFSDAEHPGTDPSIYSVSIDWGDGTSSTGDVSYDPNLNQFVVTGGHTFAQAAGTQVDLNLRVTDTTNGHVAGKEEVLTLQNAVGAPAQIGFDNATYEIHRNGSRAAITVTRTGDTSVESTVDFHVEGGTAISGVDYMPVAGELEFMPGQDSQTFTIPIYANPSVATDETLNLILSLPTGHAVLGAQATSVLTIHPSVDIFAPGAPTLDRASDTGPIADGITADNGTAARPLLFDVASASIPNGFVQLFDVTDASHPVPVGAPVQANMGTAAITVAGNAFADGVHRFAVGVSATAGSALSPLSAPLSITIDSVTPGSHVSALPAVTANPDIALHWSGADNAGGAGLASFDILVSDNGGPFAPFLQETTATSATFHGQNGHTYGFISVAHDLAGNVQATPPAAQATTQVAIPTIGIAGASAVNAGSVYTLGLLASGPGTGTITSWAVNWGDGVVQPITGNPSSVTHVFSGAGSHTITAVATDPAGRFASGNTVLVTITVAPPPPPPSFPAPPVAFVTSLYNKLLLRNPEPAGLQYWVQRLGSRAKEFRVARGIFNSREHLRLVRSHLVRVPFRIALADARRAEHQALTVRAAHPAGPHGLVH